MLYVIAGHGAGDSGAVGNGYSEAERVRALAQRIKELGRGKVALHPFEDDAYRSGAISRLNLPHDAQIVELHMDSGGAGAKGGHVIIKDGYAPDEYDNALADGISRMFPGRSNKIVGRGNLANVNRAAKRGFNYRLVENGFISDAGDVRKFNEGLDELAGIYLRAFGIETEDDMSAVSDMFMRTDDPTGRGMHGTSFYDRVLWMAKKQDDELANQKKIIEQNDKIIGLLDSIEKKL